MTHHLILSLPPADLNAVCFSSKGPLYYPQVVNVSRSVEKCWCHFCQGFLQTQLMFLFENLSCSGIKSDISTIMSIQVWIVEMKSERCLFLKIFSFEIQTSLIKDPTHYSMQSFDCLVSWKQKWPIVRFKMTCSWFFVSILNSDFGYIFWWSVMRWHFYEFQKQDAQALSRKVVSFLSIYFISMHNNQ